VLKSLPTFRPDHPWSTWVTKQLMRFGVNAVVLVSTLLIVTFSVCFTSITLLLFQGNVDLLGIIICIGVPLIIFPLPATLFYSTLLALHETDRELRARNIELENSLREVKTLNGLLPICCSCKKIRNDAGYWSDVEQYISDHSDLQLTHGFCPDCIKRLYPELQYTSP